MEIELRTMVFSLFLLLNPLLHISNVLILLRNHNKHRHHILNILSDFRVLRTALVQSDNLVNHRVNRIDHGYETIFQAVQAWSILLIDLVHQKSAEA